MPGTHPCPLMKAVIWASFSICPSCQMPKSSGDIRPSGETAVASEMTIDAPPTALLPRCTKCQSLANPSTDEYWHIGDTTIRFFSVILFRIKGLKSADICVRFYELDLSITNIWIIALQQHIVKNTSKSFERTLTIQDILDINRQPDELGRAGYFCFLQYAIAVGSNRGVGDIEFSTDDVQSNAPS